jgi:hypothetical protein
MLLLAMTSKQPVPPSRSIASPNTPTVKSHRDWGTGLWRTLDVALAAAVVHELFRSEFRLEPISGRHDVLADSFLMQTDIDRQHILEKFRHCGKRRVSSPFGQQKSSSGAVWVVRRSFRGQ